MKPIKFPIITTNLIANLKTSCLSDEIFSTRIAFHCQELFDGILTALKYLPFMNLDLSLCTYSLSESTSIPYRFYYLVFDWLSSPWPSETCFLRFGDGIWPWAEWTLHAQYGLVCLEPLYIQWKRFSSNRQ